MLDGDTAWHCGAKTYVHPRCRNENSIGVEMCSAKDSNGVYFIPADTVKNTLDLVKELMYRYQIPVERVIRHHDVTGKLCPEPFVRKEQDWKEFKSALIVTKKEEDEDMAAVRYQTVAEVPAWGQEVVKKLIGKGVFGDANKLNLTEDMVRMFVFNDRLGLYK